MEGILAMVEGPSTSEVTNFDQIDQSIFKEFLKKSTVWDFYEMIMEQYSTKDDGEKRSLILQYYNTMVKGNFCYLLSAVSDVSLKLSELFDVGTLYSVILLAKDSGLGVKFCSVFVLIINLSSDKSCSVSEALLANGLSVSESESDSQSKVKSGLSEEARLSTHF